LELYGQICFQEVAGCSNSEVRPDLVPENIREEFNRRYADPKKGFLKLPMTATFQFLRESGHEAGVRFFEPTRLIKIKSIQSSRNESILAHGIKPVSEKRIDKIFETVSEFVQFVNKFDFPLLP
jgi:superfamily I DNA and/or RNA helicase